MKRILILQAPNNDMSSGEQEASLQSDCILIDILVLDFV